MTLHLETKTVEEFGEVFIQCCECKKYRGKDGEFYSHNHEKPVISSHTYCNPCFEGWKEKLKEVRRE